MIKVFSCIASDHHYGMLLVAGLVCVLGSILTMRLYARVRRTVSVQKWNWLFLGGMIGGSTIWTTHFLAMLSFKPSLAHAYDPTLTIASLAIAIVATTLGFFVTAVRNTGPTIEIGGAIVGAGIVCMHYMGMMAYQIAGRMEWDYVLYMASAVLGIGFGAIATSRIARPVTRFCKYGGALGFMLAILTMHFTGMGALSIIPDASILPSAAFIPDHLLMVLVVAVVCIMLCLGASTYVIDLHATQVATDRFRHMSLHDSLTGLPNRPAFTEHLEAVLRGQSDDTARVAVLSINLDRFKEVNDVHGHAAGDAVLRTVSERMSAVLSEGEFLGRMGGDEFVALTSDFFMKSDAKALAAKLIAAISTPIDWQGSTVRIGTAVGISLFPVDARTPDELLAQADLAMYRAKAAGPNSVRLYDQSMDDAARNRSALAMDMRRAIDNDQFELYYQPQNDTLSREIIGFEVLLRWNHPLRGMVPPTEFIPIAEKNGFICELGDWVLFNACRQAAAWKKPVKIAVNVAPAQLADANLPNRVRDILYQTGLPASRLELEITESGIIADQQRALHVIRRLKTLGVTIAMDDYGTGYSSLSTLQNFPFDKIKIDRAFIVGVNSNRHSAAIVRSTIILAQSLDIPVLAEGVETEAHMEFLCAEGCLQVQGYLFGKPMPLSAIVHWVGDAPLPAAEEVRPTSAVAAEVNEAFISAGEPVAA